MLNVLIPLESLLSTFKATIPWTFRKYSRLENHANALATITMSHLLFSLSFPYGKHFTMKCIINVAFETMKAGSEDS